MCCFISGIKLCMALSFNRTIPDLHAVCHTHTVPCQQQRPRNSPLTFHVPRFKPKQTRTLETSRKNVHRKLEFCCIVHDLALCQGIWHWHWITPCVYLQWCALYLFPNLNIVTSVVCGCGKQFSSAFNAIRNRLPRKILYHIVVALLILMILQSNLYDLKHML